MNRALAAAGIEAVFTQEGKDGEIKAGYECEEASEGERAAKLRERLTTGWMLGEYQAEAARIESIINNLLDNLSSENREMVDQRLKDLNSQRKQLQNRLDELEQLENNQDQIAVLTSEALCFLRNLEHVLISGLPQEKLMALRQCIKKIWVNKPAGEITSAVRTVPRGNLQATREFKMSV